jgi:hypothetical protein
MRDDMLVLEHQLDASVLEQAGELFLVPKGAPDRDVGLQALQPIPGF